MTLSLRTLPTIPVLTAPTAAGKSALALELADGFPLEIVAADAFTVYRGLDIGTAKPDAAELRRVPHHLIDVADVADDFDVTQFVTLAEARISDIQSRGHIPLIVGGTGFYISALIRGLPLTPPSVQAEREVFRPVRRRGGLGIGGVRRVRAVWRRHEWRLHGGPGGRVVPIGGIGPGGLLGGIGPDRRIRSIGHIGHRVGAGRAGPRRDQGA